MENDDNKAHLPVNMVSERVSDYGIYRRNRISVFHSFEEAAEADYAYYRSLSPEQRMNIHYELTVRLFGEAKNNLKRRFSF